VPAQEFECQQRLMMVADMTRDSSGIAIALSPAEESVRLAIHRSRVVVSVWREGSNVVRGTITHASGAVAHFQGGESLLQMAQLLGFRVATLGDETSDQAEC
jgi:hypothetical protein